MQRQRERQMATSSAKAAYLASNPWFFSPNDIFSNFLYLVIDFVLKSCTLVSY